MLKLIPLALLAAMTASALAACNETAADGRYATFDRGRSNNRAYVLPDPPVHQQNRQLGELPR
jgi:hypothetical protein